ncbi:MAG: hypothetical protein ACQESR_14790 [Planctomycetota bacterium]
MESRPTQAVLAWVGLAADEVVRDRVVRDWVVRDWYSFETP